MVSGQARPKLIAIVGPTASGKSELALWAAKRFGGEIIAADSRTIYKSMDIGTAKPSAQDQKAVRHWGLDLVRPDQDFNVADFKAYAQAAILDIQGRGKLPILTGGSGLYADAVLYDYQFSPKARERDPKNPRHLKVPTRQIKKLRPGTVIVGLRIDNELKERISRRVDRMVDEGLADEVGKLAERYSWQGKAMLAPGYLAFRKYLEGESTLEEAKAAFVQKDLNLAKRQWTWFKRNPDIQWFESTDSATIFLTKIL